MSRAAHRELGLELRIVRAEAELHAAVGRERGDAREQRVGVRFADAVRMEALEIHRGLHAALREDARDDLLFEHAAHLARHARA